MYVYGEYDVYEYVCVWGRVYVCVCGLLCKGGRGYNGIDICKCVSACVCVWGRGGTLDIDICKYICA